MATIVGEPKIDTRPEKHCIGIRVQTPREGMFAVADQLRKELNDWMKERGIEPDGPYFLRYHVIDMAGEMDIEFGVQLKTPVAGDDRVSPGVIPAGRYASLIYVGTGMPGNVALMEWAKTNGLKWDSWNDPKGDAFRCRCETYLTDPKTEHRKKKWEIELAIKLADNQT